MLIFLFFFLFFFFTVNKFIWCLHMTKDDMRMAMNNVKCRSDVWEQSHL